MEEAVKKLIEAKKDCPDNCSLKNSIFPCQYNCPSKAIKEDIKEFIKKINEKET